MSNWHKGDHLAWAAQRAGLDLAELDAAVAADPERYAGVVAANQASQRRAGHWGVPLMVFRREPFFGQDRFDQLVWRLRQAGLAPRPSVRERPAPEARGRPAPRGRPQGVGSDSGA